jgi:carbamoyl-phosphate synthase large subunit
LKLANDLYLKGVPIIGTSTASIDEAEDRERFQQLVEKLGLLQPPNGIVTTLEQGVGKAEKIGYPIVLRPSYVLGGRAMEVVFDQKELTRYLKTAFDVSNKSPVLLDRFLEDAIEIDIDAICDGEQVVIGAIMQHIEQAGVHSGDSACSLPPYSLGDEVLDSVRTQIKSIALELGVVGLMNVQMAIQNNVVYLIEVNPRASRTVPFVSKCIGYSLAKVAARCMVGRSLLEQGITQEIIPQKNTRKRGCFSVL